MKKCPKCNIYYSEEEYEGCTVCGSDLVSCEDPNHIGNDSIFMGGVHSDNHQGTNAELENEHSNVKIGNDNTFTGGVHSSDDHTKANSDNEVHTNSHNTINNTTIYEAVKSRSELLEADEYKFRLECKKFFVNGLISREGELQLSELLTTLKLPDATAETIKEQVRQQSIKRIQPTAQVISGIRQTKSIIELNNGASLLRQLKQLESWMREYDDDTLKLMYYQMSAILEPAQFTSRYEKSAKNEYWEAYWAYIAYLKQAQDKQSFDARALSGKLGLFAGQPESNDVILHLAGLLIQNDQIDDIAKERNTLTANYTSELKPLLGAIDELLQKNWESESITIRPSHALYINALFTNFVETQTAAGKKRLDDIRREADRISRAERERQNEIKRQKDIFLQKYREVQNYEKACGELGLSELTVSTWLNEDPVFNSLYNRITLDVEKRKAQDIENRRIAQELEANTRRLKSEFRILYEKNHCDFFRTCSELDINSKIIKKWREEDKAFDDALTSIERENERVQHEEFIKCYELNDCDLRKTCAEMGVSMDIVNNWRKSNQSFDEALTSIKREYDQLIQDAFIRYYATNDCNLRKTCDEMNLNEAVIREWRDIYESFNESLLDLERERDDRIAEGIRIDRWKAFMKSLPYIIIGLLIFLIVIAMAIRSSNRKEEARKLDVEMQQTEEVRATYNSKIAQFNEHYAHITRNKEGITKLEEAISVLNEIKKIESEKSTYLISKESVRLTNDIEKKCKELMQHFNTMRHNDDEFVKRDGEQLYNAVENIKRKL